MKTDQILREISEQLLPEVERYVHVLQEFHESYTCSSQYRAERVDILEDLLNVKELLRTEKSENNRHIALKFLLNRQWDLVALREKYYRGGRFDQTLQ